MSGEGPREWTITVCTVCGRRVDDYCTCQPELPALESVRVVEVSPSGQEGLSREEIEALLARIDGKDFYIDPILSARAKLREALAEARERGTDG